MTTGTKNKVTSSVLKVTIGLCLVFALVNFGGFIYQHTPRFKEGECFTSTRQGITAVIERNNIMAGYSDVAATYNGITQRGPVAFVELRHPTFKKMECQ